MTRTLCSFGAILATAVLVAVAGCADAAQPVAPVVGEPSLSSSSGPDLSQLARFQTRPQVTIAWAKKWIGPEGGRLDFLGFAIDVPAGAVDRVTQFTIKLPVDPKGGEHVVAEFLPHGATFAKPVGIELPYSGTTLVGSSSPTIVWWNGVWVDMGASVTSDGQRLRTLTDHFSTYGTTEERGYSIAVSGG
jgi:hypothetical protein